ncbi:hypothetical protein FB566_3293 [Stackebrandtia endophytica]|uniref:Uncharacterized protein n=1 Tax=Stackebrandtia endophytica TaxID=1496996 RepID=A0A543AYS2_9ACTN|nr:hypothetical protein [Stackebrandtia endophytica]TQL77729.1 hypothetical protein FB566_3293 [Stackebrandtia endophytica]
MTTNTLTERYVREVVRRIPGDQRDEVANELRATIADTVDAREGADRDAVERDVIQEMGDPIRLAARYADRPLALIGPVFYPTYIRLLTTLMSIVLPIVVVVTVAVDIIENNDLGSAIGTGIGATVTVAAQMFGWLTLVFACIERWQPKGDPAIDPWTPDRLPDVKLADKQAKGAVASLVWYGFLIALITWQHTAQPVILGGDRLEVLNPVLWNNWTMWTILAGLGALMVIEVIRLAARRWTMSLAIAASVAEGVFAVPLIWVLYEREFFNPEFLAKITVLDEFYLIAIFGVVALGVFEVVNRFRMLSRGE